MIKKQFWFVLSLAAVRGPDAGQRRARGPHPQSLGAVGDDARGGQETGRRAAANSAVPQNDRWQLQSSETMNHDTIEMLECTGYIVRTYANREDGRRGEHVRDRRPRRADRRAHARDLLFHPELQEPRHPPSGCDTGAQGQEISSGPLRSSPRMFRKTCSASIMRGARATAGRPPTTPRFAFVGWPYLYKIQLSSTLPAGTDLKSDDTCREFLKDFVPVLRQYLVEPSKR